MWGLVMSRGRSVEGHGECPVAEAVAATGRVRTGQSRAGSHGGGDRSQPVERGIA